jgi:hypothetical protein
VAQDALRSGHPTRWPSRAGAAFSLTEASEEYVINLIRGCSDMMKARVPSEYWMDFSRRQLAEARLRNVAKGSALDVALRELEVSLERAQERYAPAVFFSSMPLPQAEAAGGGSASRYTPVGVHPHHE